MSPAGGRKRSAVETSESEPVDARVDSEFGTIGSDRVFQHYVEQLLVPVELQVVGEAGRLHVRARRFIRRERFVRRQRYARVKDAGRRKQDVVLVDRDVVDQMKLCGIAQRLVGA